VETSLKIKNRMKRVRFYGLDRQKRGSKESERNRGALRWKTRAIRNAEIPRGHGPEITSEEEGIGEKERESLRSIA